MKFRVLKGYKYELLEPEVFITNIQNVSVTSQYHSLATTGELTAKVGYCWDGASGPTWDDETNYLSACCHDLGYQLLREDRLLPSRRQYFDKLLRDMSIEASIKLINNKSFLKNRKLPRIVKVSIDKAIKAFLIKVAKVRYNTWYKAVRYLAKDSSKPKAHPRGKVIEVN